MTCLLGFFVPLKVPEGEDTLCWKEDRRGISSVKSYYCSLSGENNFLSQNLLFCLGSYWRKILIVNTLMKRE